MSGDNATDDAAFLRSIFQSVIIRAICDALGYTNLNPAKSAHTEAVKEARAWFIEDNDGILDVCDLAGVDPDKIRDIAKKLIHAKATGDHSRVPEFWRFVFAQNRMPNLTNIEKALDLSARAT